MTARRKEEVNAARRRQKKRREERGNETGKVVIVHGSVEPAKGHQLVDKPKEFCTGKRRRPA